MDAQLAALQEAKNKLAVEVQEHAKRQAEWNDADKAKWNELNTSYDAAAEAVSKRREDLTASEAVQKRLAEIEAESRASRGDKVNEFDGDKRRESDPERVLSRSYETRALAMQGWALAQSGMELRDEHKRTLRELDFNPSNREIVLAPDGAIYRATGGSDACDLPVGTARRQYGEASWSHGGRQAQREVRVGLDVATSGAGLETIPEGFMNQLEKKTLAYGSVRQVAKIVNTATGNSMPFPVVDDTGNVAAILAEATTISTSVDPTFSAITMLAYKLSSKPVFVSAEILQDSAFNLASELAELMGIRFGRGENVYFTTGNNSSQPQGVVAAAGTGVTSAAAAAFTADELIALVHSLDPSYRALPSTGFMMKDDVVGYVRKFKDANGQYLWQPGMQAGVPDRIYGYPVIVNQQMTGLTSNVPVTATKHVLFGAFEKYLIRDAGGVRMYHLTERYRDLDQDCFVAFKRIDGRALNTAAFKVLLQA